MQLAVGPGGGQALLESGEIVLRAGYRRRIQLAAIAAVAVEGDELRLTVYDETIALGVGAAEARRGATKIASPPPTLRAKLGLADGAKVLVVGEVPAGPLDDALWDAAEDDPLGAAMTVSALSGAEQIVPALERHGQLAAGAPIWIMHGRGKGVASGEAIVRQTMRVACYMDNLVTAVAETMSATRFKAIGA